MVWAKIDQVSTTTSNFYNPSNIEKIYQKNFSDNILKNNIVLLR